jgi:fumarylacetoacetate (FAA) hydrolase
MKLAMYHLNSDIDKTHVQRPASSSAGRSAWVTAHDTLVDVSRAYQLVARRHGQFDAEKCALYQSVDGLIEAFNAEDGWDWLEQLKREFEHLVEGGDEQALNCCYSLADVRLVMPFRPKSFRDFYAFEQHVVTCRRRRGLDMVPEWYDMPVFYFSNVSGFRGPDDPVWAPRGCRELDFELEVGCVIGKAGESVPCDKADDLIAGYVILNDWSARDIQRHEVKVGLGPAKGKDFATSIGPYFVTPSEIEDVAQVSEHGRRHRLTMTAAVNGREVSRGNMADIHYTFAQMIERASADVTLYPGELIGSGTVGTGCILELGTEVQPWLMPGDVVTLEVERFGRLCTPIVEHPFG